MMPTFRPHSGANAERMEFAKKLINLMRDHNMNQSDLARKAGLTRDAISTYVRARSMPEPINLAKLAKALGVEPSYFQLDAYRVAGRMATPEPFDARAEIAAAFTRAANTPNRCEIKMQPDGTARIEILANVSMQQAVEIAAAYRETFNAKDDPF